MNLSFKLPGLLRGGWPVGGGVTFVIHGSHLQIFPISVHIGWGVNCLFTFFVVPPHPLKDFLFQVRVDHTMPFGLFFFKTIHLLWKSPFHPKLCQDIRCHPLCSSIKSVFQVTSTCYQYSIQGVLQVTSACCQRSIQSVLQVTVTNVVSRASSKLLQDVINVGTKSVFQVTSTWYQCSIKDVVLGTLLPPPHPTPPHPTPQIQS